MTIIVLIAGCAHEAPATDPELVALAATYGRTVEWESKPVDRTDSLDGDAADDGVIGEVRGTTRHGRIRLRRYENWHQRKAAERALPGQGERTAQGFSAHAGCQDILFEFRGYDDASAAVRHALASIQMLQFSFDGVCQRGPAPPADTTTSDPAVFTLVLTATPAGSSVEVHGTTNLPDGSMITLLASRALRLRGESDMRSTRVAGGSTMVTSGEFSAALAMDDDQLLLMADPVQPVDALSTAVLVCAQFRTGEESGQPIQTASVSEVVGPQGENLRSSPNMQVFGSALPQDEQEVWLEASATVDQPEVPTDAMAAQQGPAPSIDPSLTPFCLA